MPWRPFPVEGRHARELVLPHQTCELVTKRTTSVVTSRHVFAAVSVHLCVIENFTRLRPRPRPKTWKCVLKDPRGQGHVLEDSITDALTPPPLFPEGNIFLNCTLLNKILINCFNFERGWIVSVKALYTHNYNYHLITESQDHRWSWHMPGPAYKLVHKYYIALLHKNNNQLLRYKLYSCYT